VVRGSPGSLPFGLQLFTLPKAVIGVWAIAGSGGSEGRPVWLERKHKRSTIAGFKRMKAKSLDVCDDRPISVQLCFTRLLLRRATKSKFPIISNIVDATWFRGNVDSRRHARKWLKNPPAQKR